MPEDLINYGALIDDAMHVIVKKALEIVAQKGLPGYHHFFISFLTHYPGVTISDKLKKKYSEEMTIVLQYQFEELYVDEEKFSVILSFDGAKECIVVPFKALTAFADPSVKFGLQFRHTEEQLRSASGEQPDEIPQKAGATKKKRRKKDSTDSAIMSDNVVTLDAFRKNPPPKR